MTTLTRASMAVLLALLLLGMAGPSWAAGKRGASSSATEVSQVKICPSCGHENPTANEFCEECGAELKAAPVKEKKVPKTEVQNNKLRITDEYGRPMLSPEEKRAMRYRNGRNVMIAGAVTCSLSLIPYLLANKYWGNYETDYETYKAAGYSDVEAAREKAEGTYSKYLVCSALTYSTLGVGGTFFVVGFFVKGKKPPKTQSSGLDIPDPTALYESPNNLEVAYVWKW